MQQGGIDINMKKAGIDVVSEGARIVMNVDRVMARRFLRGDLTGVKGAILEMTPIQSPLTFFGLEVKP